MQAPTSTWLYIRPHYVEKMSERKEDFKHVLMSGHRTSLQILPLNMGRYLFVPLMFMAKLSSLH